ncbi:MAG: valine--tRNA ligase [Thermodesulfobacteriota bacterium]
MKPYEELAKAYEPKDVEKRWYEFWESEGLFSAQEKSGKPSYSIVIPPPNVTGMLHMGHALNATLQDILCRFHKLSGYNVLWMPGTDHAGIATQNVVERKLAAEGTDRHAVGREKFVERVWEWRKEYGGIIIKQLKRMGAMCDWPRERFTMDEGLSRAVRKVFVELYHHGLIYQGDYIINWCPRCRTALADLEVEHEPLAGHLYQITYPLAEGEGGLTVATTRPETMLGDTAVAVNPEDPRYSGFSGKRVKLPLTDRVIPVIADSYVDLSFGTGALKVTPAHDPNDFTLGQKHGLPSVKVIGDDGRMTEEAGAAYAGMDRFEARKKVVADLEALGLLQKIDKHEHAVGHCYRCKTIVEPNLSKQWFVRTKPLADLAIEAVRDGRTRIVPDTWNKTYFDWLENIRDWCISRQIWWGHRIPAWTCAACGQIIVEMEDPVKCPHCEGTELSQDTDVLDTWFSSALWPFSTMGWPDQTDLLHTFYPTSVLVTAFDILFFWVARMMMMGIWFLKDVPFRDVYIHALVRDAEGKKMSKSKGNVIDPLEVIDVQGTDAFRFTLAAFAAQGRDIKLSMERIEGFRHFINKLWNAARFALPHIHARPEAAAKKPASRSVLDRYILSRLSRVIAKVGPDIKEYRFNEAAGALYQFTWHEFCDWYLEAVKPILYQDCTDEEKDAAVNTLATVFQGVLTCLHPFTPFVTEELWQKLPQTEGSIMKASWPSSDDPETGIVADQEAEDTIALVVGVVTAVRNIRGEMNISPSAVLSASVRPSGEKDAAGLSRMAGMIKNLARLSELSVDGAAHRPKGSATAVFAGNEIFVSLSGVLDLAKETERLQKEIGKLDKDLSKTSAKLNNEDFLAKAPEEVRQKVVAQQEELAEKRDKLTATLDRIKEIQAVQ